MIALTEQPCLPRIQSAPNRRDLRSQTTRALRRDRNAYWKAIAEQYERAAACGDTRKVCQMLKGVSRRPAGLFIERVGSVIPDQAGKLWKWEEHFKALLNHAPPPNTAFSPRPTSTTKTYTPTLEEVCIRQLRNNRAPGEDGIPVEVYKTCLDSLGPCLHGMITSLVLWGRPT